MIDEDKREAIADVNPDAIIYEGEGFEECIVGMVDAFNLSAPVVCYDYEMLIEAIMNSGGDEDERMSWDDAIEYFEYKIR